MKAKAATSSVTVALLYTRVSTKGQEDEGMSLDAQLDEARSYVVRHGWLIGAEFQDVLSGKRDDRPAYQALLADVRARRAAGENVAVVVAALDRFGRKLLERVRAREELKALGVPTHSVREGGEVSDLVANILASVAQEESRRIGERVKATSRHISGRGFWIGGRVAWGYRLRDATEAERAAGAPTRVLEVDPDTAPAVCELFLRAANGASVNELKRWAGTLSPAERGGRVLAGSVIGAAIRSAVYAARHEAGADDVLERPIGNWPALVDDGTYRRVQERLASHQKQPKQASGRFLLTGLLRCPMCDSRMSGSSKSHGKRRYRCSALQRGANAATDCQWVCLADNLERLVEEDVVEILDTIAAPGSHDALRSAWAALRTPERSDDESRREELHRQVRQAKERLTKATEAFVDGMLDRDGYEGLVARNRAQLEAAELELVTLERRVPTRTLPDLNAVLANLGGWSEAWTQADAAVRRDVVGTLTDRVVPSRTVRGRNARLSVTITWTPVGEALKAAVEASRERAAA